MLEDFKNGVRIVRVSNGQGIEGPFLRGESGWIEGVVNGQGDLEMLVDGMRIVAVLMSGQLVMEDERGKGILGREVK